MRSYVPHLAIAIVVLLVGSVLSFLRFGNGLQILILAAFSGVVSYLVERLGSPYRNSIGHVADAVKRLTGETPSLADGAESESLVAAIDQARIDLEARESEQVDTATLLSRILDGMQQGVFAIDADRRVIFANRSAEQILGVPSRTAQKRLFNDITRNVDLRECIQAMFAEDATDTREASLEITTYTKDIYDVNAARLPWNPFPGIVVVMHDVTELRRLEEVRREFVANVSHELKTPLSCIKAYSETLQNGAIDDPKVNRNFLRQIEEQADRLHELIIDMLQLARLEAGSEAFQITSVRLNAIAAQSMGAFEESAVNKKIDLRCIAKIGDIEVRADAEGVRQIMDNLIDNAIKYSTEGGEVLIDWRAEDDMAVIEVTDKGIGIREEDQVVIFGRFYRVDRARSRELGSTGLGLSIVKHLAQSFGGVAGVNSEYGKGSRFFVRIPLA